MATYTAVLVVPNELDQDYVIEQLERLGVVAFCGPGSLVQDIGEDGDPVEREVRLDEARIADEMDRESVRGISPPDY